MAIDSEIVNKIKRVSAYDITKEYKDESMKSVNTVIDSLSRDIVNEFNNTSDKTHTEAVTETMLKALYDSEMD